jgi:Zn-dependent M28 family amino/carboxypeptidase
MQMARNEQQATGPQTLPLIAHLQWTSQSVPGTLTNVLGVLPGQDTGGQDALIIVGAHRDHFGEQAGLPFPGADDNASGTAVMLELARVLSQRHSPLKHTIVFASFDGEEQGLLGSTLYVNNPAFPLERTRAMINLDHVGVGNGKLTVGVTRLKKAVIQQAAKDAGLAKQVEVFGYFPGGDHVPFFEAGVPTITIVSSGVHPHFHQPSDTSNTIQPEILETTSRFLLSLISLVADHPQPAGHPEPTAKDLSPG